MIMKDTRFVIGILCLCLIIIRAYKDEGVYRQTYTSMEQEMARLYNNVLDGIQNHSTGTTRKLSVAVDCETPVFMPTTSMLVAIDLCDILKLFAGITELHQMIGFNISTFCDIVRCDLISEIRSLSVVHFQDNETNLSENVQCSVYNISVVSTGNHNHDIIDAITQCPCQPWSIRHLFKAAPHQIPSVTKLQLQGVPMHDLLIEDLLYFPNLQAIFLRTLPLTSESLENELLCHSPNLKTFYFGFSQGHLQKFPSHIFNCSNELTIKLICFWQHKIAYLPAYAFRSAAKSVKFVELRNIGLVMIHKEAFAELQTVEILTLVSNKITATSPFTIPPSTDLHLLEIRGYQSNSVNLSTLEIKKQKHLSAIIFNGDNIYNLTGMFCSDDNNSKLKLLTLESNAIRELLPPLFDNCESLKYLSLYNNTLSDLDAELLKNVSLDGLDLSHNALTDNVSWPRILAQQHELQYLNLSSNGLVSWTQDMSAVWQLKQLDISWNLLSAVALTAFANLTRLELLSLEGNWLCDPEIICELPFIQEISLAENFLNSVPCVLNVSNIQLIDVSSNNISYLIIGKRKECSSQCHDITLYAENNKLSSFLLTCSDIQRYAVVDLSNNTLKDFFDIFPDVKTGQCFVRTLNVSWNMFRDISLIPDFIDTTNLNSKHHVTLLDMRYCGLQSISMTIYSILEVSELDLRHNEIHEIDERMFYVVAHNLIMDLKYNQLYCDCSLLWLKKHLQYQSEVGGIQIFASYCLHSLWYERVLIQSVPDDMFLCVRMCPVSMTMICSHITCFIGDDTGLDAVMCYGYSSGLSSALNTVKSQIYISGGHIPMLELSATQTTQLKYLNLTSCNISTISPSSFNYTPDLEVLVLARNFIQTLSRSTLLPLVRLQYLDLSHNLFQSFEAEMFSGILSLETMHLNSNQITRLDDDTLDVLESLQHLSLQGNPWQCSCNFTFKHWIVVNQAILNQPQKILCNGTGVPVMLSNVTCTYPMYIASGHTKTHVVIPSALAVILTVFLIIGGLVYKYRFEICVLKMIYLPRCLSYKDSAEGPCGIFAIHDHETSVAYMWVMRDLINKVEPGCPVLCYHKTFEPGVDIMDNVEDAINKSNCAVLLLTEHFLANGWAIEMIQAAYATKTERPYNIIPVLGHGVSATDITSNELCPAIVRVLLKTPRVLDLSQKLFWESLVYLLPDSCKAKILSHPDNGE